MSKTTILYKDIAPGADLDAAATTNGAQPFSQTALLPFGGDEDPVASCEGNHWGLNGRFHIVDTQRVAFWSAAQSGKDCVFSQPPVITITFDKQYSSLGLTLQFDTGAGDYCTSVNLKWYQGAALKADGDFAPNAPVYFCSRRVENYDRVVLTLHATSLPGRYAKLEKLLFGVYRHFGMSELRRAAITNEMDALAVELPVSKLIWTLDSREDVDFMFQLKQPAEARNNDSLIGVYYIDSYRRTAENVYAIDCYDAFGVLDEMPFSGGVYTNASAKALLESIVNPYFTVTVSAADANLTGAILPCTRREAFQQVVFAWGVCAATDGSVGIRVFAPEREAVSVGEERTFLGASVETAALVTEVRVTAHSYVQDAQGSVEIGGAKYRDSQTVYTVKNPNVTASDKQNVVEVNSATLVSPAIGQITAQRVYDHFQRRGKSNAKLVWGGERLGACLSVPNSWGGRTAGTLVKMDVTLSNTVVANCETLGVQV